MELRGALRSLPCHGLLQALAAEDVSRLCFHQVALFEDMVVTLNVLEMMSDINVRFVACAVIDEPNQWRYDGTIPDIKT